MWHTGKILNNLKWREIFELKENRRASRNGELAQILAQRDQSEGLAWANRVRCARLTLRRFEQVTLNHFFGRQIGDATKLKY